MRQSTKASADQQETKQCQNKNNIPPIGNAAYWGNDVFIGI